MAVKHVPREAPELDLRPRLATVPDGMRAVTATVTCRCGHVFAASALVPEADVAGLTQNHPRIRPAAAEVPATFDQHATATTR